MSRIIALHPADSGQQRRKDHTLIALFKHQFSENPALTVCGSIGSARHPPLVVPAGRRGRIAPP
jgi:hypothetical protein